MESDTPNTSLTGALEDYLETVFELVRDRKLARIKDIAKARGVKSGSVSPAMRRLAQLGLVNYVEREYIDLTDAGEKIARRVYAKHQVLTRFFVKVLKMPQDAAQADACAMEHSLSDDAMDHLVRFSEFLEGCPDGALFLEKFHQCSAVHSGLATCEKPCPLQASGETSEQSPRLTIAQMEPGQTARVCQITDAGAIRHGLLEKGIVPDARLILEHAMPARNAFVIELQGFNLTLNKKEAESTVVRPL
jgi:DtxR family Mn-dependent transcriptional regulator